MGEGELSGERLSSPWLGRLCEGRVLGLSAAPPGASWALPGYRDPPGTQARSRDPSGAQDSSLPFLGEPAGGSTSRGTPPQLVLWAS